MSTVNWDEIKFRASSWGNLMTDSKDKKEVIGKTCAGELIKIYNQEKYGRKKEIITKAMDKGRIVEDASISMYSKLDGIIYFKNDEQLENEWFTGHPDVFSGKDIYHADTVDDMKNSWELDSFTPWLIEGADKSGICQLNVYYSLTGAKSGSLVRALMDCPPEILEGEKRKLLYSMNVISEFSPDYVKACEELVKNLTFPDIPEQERLIKITVPRDEELIQKMKDKVPVMREWLKNFHERHMNLYPK